MNGYEWEMTLRPPLWVWVVVIGFIISFASAVWVFGDADREGIEPPYWGLWTVIVFLFPILGLLLYVTVGRRQAETLRESSIDREPETKTCKFCDRTLAPDATWCDACGRAQE
jgi:hypothetical protein